MFRVGDRIVLVEDIAKDILKGARGTIMDYLEKEDVYHVDFDGDSDWYSGWMLFPSRMTHDKEHRVLQILRQWQRSR